MNVLGVLYGIRSFLTRLTDILIAGRQRGLWQEGHRPDLGPHKPLEPLHFKDYPKDPDTDP